MSVQTGVLKVAGKKLMKNMTTDYRIVSTTLHLGCRSTYTNNK